MQVGFNPIKYNTRNIQKINSDNTSSGNYYQSSFHNYNKVSFKGNSSFKETLIELFNKTFRDYTRKDGQIQNPPKEYSNKEVKRQQQKYATYRDMLKNHYKSKDFKFAENYWNFLVHTQKTNPDGTTENLFTREERGYFIDKTNLSKEETLKFKDENEIFYVKQNPISHGKEYLVISKDENADEIIKSYMGDSKKDKYDLTSNRQKYEYYKDLFSSQTVTNANGEEQPRFNQQQVHNILLTIGDNAPSRVRFLSKLKNPRTGKLLSVDEIKFYLQIPVKRKNRSIQKELKDSCVVNYHGSLSSMRIYDTDELGKWNKEHMDVTSYREHILSSNKTITNSNGQNTKRFTENEYIAMITTPVSNKFLSFSEEKERIKLLIDKKIKAPNGKDFPMFNFDEILYFLDHAEIPNDEIIKTKEETVVSAKQRPKSLIVTYARTNKDIEHYKKLLENEQINKNGKFVPRFTKKQTEELAKLSLNNKEGRTEFLINSKKNFSYKEIRYFLEHPEKTGDDIQNFDKLYKIISIGGLVATVPYFYDLKKYAKSLNLQKIAPIKATNMAELFKYQKRMILK